MVAVVGLKVWTAVEALIGVTRYTVVGLPC